MSRQAAGRSGQAGKVPSPLRRAIDFQYRVYDRVRHPDAARVAATAGRTGSFKGLASGGYCLLVTFKRDGTPVPTPVLFAHHEGKVYVRTEPSAAKVKRIRRDPHVRVVACNPRGKPRGSVFEGRARLLPSEEEERAHDILWHSYTASMRLYEGTVDHLPVPLTYIEITPMPDEAEAGQ